MSSPFQEQPCTAADADVDCPDSTQPVLLADVKRQETLAEVDGQESQEVSVFAIERNCERLYNWQCVMCVNFLPGAALHCC